MNGETYTFKPENIFHVLDTMKKTHDLLMQTDTEKLCDIYKQIVFVDENGMYELSEATIDSLVEEIKDRTLLDLVDKGLMEMTWDPDLEQPTYRLTEEGMKKGKELNEE